MSLIRVRQNAQATISHTFSVDETATDAVGSVTYSVKRLDGTVVASGTASHPGTTGLYTFTLAAQSLVDIFTVDWTGSVGGGAVTVRDYVEVVGGFLFSLDEMRSARPALDSVRFSTQNLIDARLEAEVIAEKICAQAFVPRFARFELDGNNDFALVLPIHTLRTVRAVSTGTNTTDRVALTGSGLTAVEFSEAGIISRRGAVWMWGRKNIVVEVEYGLDYPPEQIHRAAIIHARSLLTQTDTSIPNRATSVQGNPGGATYSMAGPSAERTGITAVDALYGATRLDAGFA